MNLALHEMITIDLCPLFFILHIVPGITPLELKNKGEVPMQFLINGPRVRVCRLQEAPSNSCDVTANWAFGDRCE